MDSIPSKSLQHTLNNPLAGLLAELQLLEMEDLPENHRAAVERCIELTRRVVQIVREQVPKDL
jgi:nitrogen-specific signal transduction histidine kinase